MPHPSAPNFTAITNWKSKGFGCAKACSYCNWRQSPLLPHGPQSDEAILAFIRQCTKSFITISGGGDPLYRLDDNLPALRHLCDLIHGEGFRVRIITREVGQLHRVAGLADYVSLSLDAEVLRWGARNLENWKSEKLTNSGVPDLESSPRWGAEKLKTWKSGNLENCGGPDLEFSLVLPPVPMPDLLKLKPQYAALRQQLGTRLVLRENFNSIFPFDPEAMSFGHQGIVIVPKSVCLNSRYLATIDCTGHEIVQDHAPLAAYLMNHSSVYLFGGFVKHLIAPSVHLEYADIDVIATNAEVMTTLEATFGYRFTELPNEKIYPRYFQGRSSRAGKPIQLLLMHSPEDARKFIFNAQYDIDRIGYHQGFLIDPLMNLQEIKQSITQKQARLLAAPRQLDLFHPQRMMIEQKHKAKLLSKGFMIAA